MATPRYRVLADTFIEPTLVYAGSIISTDSEPGNHLDPLNDEARERMEAWYSAEFPEVDKDGKKTGNMIRPHEQYRIQRFEPAPKAEMIIEALPPKNMVGGLSLAEVMVNRPATDQRPGPRQSFAEPPPEPNADTEIELLAPRPPIKQKA